jgi:hypothetical protein
LRTPGKIENAMAVVGVIEASDDQSGYRVKPLLFSVQAYLSLHAQSELSAGASYAAMRDLNCRLVVKCV